MMAAVLFFACGKKNPENLQEEAKPLNGSDSIEAEEDKPEDDIKETQESKSEGGAHQNKIRDIPSAELVTEIKIGWNLGNTLDATGGKGLNTESSWGNPATTKEMIDTVRKAGFNILRIPTTWEKHLGPALDYVIDAGWLDRVQEVVDYAMDNEMFAILNLHHEEWYSPSLSNAEAAKDILTKVWKQIAERFENYDEYLIFEGMNEPRVKGGTNEWSGGLPEQREVLDQLNAAFVETIRSTGGNNPLRHLMIPTYAASSHMNALDLVVPEDDKIIISIHAYTPYDFALNTAGTSEWSLDNARDTGEIDHLMNNLYNTFLKKDIPVIIGEFGAIHKNNKEIRVAWAEYYIKRAAEKGIPCIWWDNGGLLGGGEVFGLLDRRNLTWKYPEVVEALMRGLPSDIAAYGKE